MKREVLSSEPKVTVAKVKGEQKSAASVKAELQQQEAKVAPCTVAKLVERGLQLRAMANKIKEEGKLKKEGKAKVKAELKHVKKESGKKGKVKKELKRVKKEGAKGGKAKGKRKRKPSAAMSKARREVMSRAITLSPELAEIVGAPALSRPEVVSRLWKSFREEGLLNPADKRQVLFNEKLQAVFGKPSARVFEMHHLLLPHLNYAEAPATPEAVSKQPKAKGEKPSSAKKEEAGVKAKREANSLQPPQKAKGEASTKQEVAPAASAPKPELPQQTKRERSVAAVFAKPEQAPQGTAKRERREELVMDMSAAARSIVPRFTKIGKTNAQIEFQGTALGSKQLEVVAEAIGADSTVIRPCLLEFREGLDGDMELVGSAVLENLQPAAAYRISVRTVSAPSATSAEVILPQRACPARWIQGEVQLYCSALQVPELARKVREYGIDGATLLSLQEEDLRALGVLAPFLMRRVLAALKELQTA